MRTIFVNLFSILAVDNFYIPGGVLDILVNKKTKDTKLVFLTSRTLKEKLERFQNETVLIETIESYPPKGLIQKVFHFFYAFLIFTGSTKILATFGARADIPPAGGNRHVWFIKAFIANTFGRSRFIKRSVTPWLYNLIFRTRPYRSIFDRHNPDWVMVPGLAFYPDIEIAAEAKRRGIYTLGMVMNWDHLNKYYIPIHADYLLVQNEPMKREAIVWHAYREEEVSIVGFPQFDMYERPEDFLFPRETFLQSFGIERARKIILFISGAAYSKDEPDIIRTISQWISEGVFGVGVKLLVRPYTPARDLEREKEKYQGLENDPNIAFNWLRRSDNVDNKRYFMSMLEYSNVIISIFSTTAIEAAIFDKPTITVGFDGYKKRPYHESIVRLEDMSHFRNVLDTGSVKVVRSFSDLKESLLTYLEKPESDREKRKLLVEKMCYRADGRASERIADFVLKTYGK